MPHFCGHSHARRDRRDAAQLNGCGQPERERKLPAAVRPATREEIAALAYSYWQARGCQGGSPVEDWLRAERELRERQPA